MSVRKGGWKMRRYLMVVVLILCFLIASPQISWSNEDEKPETEGFHPLCGSCKTLCETTIKAIPLTDNMKCFAYGEIFSSVCSAASGANPASTVLCFTGGVVATDVCSAKYGTPQNLIKDPGGAAKYICKGVKLCK